MAREIKRDFSLSLGMIATWDKSADRIEERFLAGSPALSKSLPLTAKSFKVKGTFSAFIFFKRASHFTQVGAGRKSSLHAEKSACFKSQSSSKIS